MRFPRTFFPALAAILTLAAAPIHAVTEDINSPHGRLRVEVDTSDGLTLRAWLDGRVVLEPAPLRLNLSDGRSLGTDASTMTLSRRRNRGVVTPVIKQKSATIPDNFNEATFTSAEFSVAVRVYDDGLAYRFSTTLGGTIEVTGEAVPLAFPAGTRTLFPEEESFMSHNERSYLDFELADITSPRFASLPVLCTTPAGIRVVFTDADLFDYPGMFVRGTGGSVLTPTFPPYPLEIVPAENGTSDRNVEIKQVGDFIARTSGTRSFPWRTYVVTDDDRDLITSQLVFLLSRECELADTSWIKPGTVAWDWYNANNLIGVDFESGINNDTYKFYIDFAARFGINYVILDEGWSAATTNLFEPNPDIDVPELVAYGAARNVGIILWSLNEPLAKDRDALLDLYASWGVKGVKIDFMQRNDQLMVNFYHDTAVAAAARHLLVDYHGAFKPSGLRRAYPNVISYEGVKGNENNKWSADVTPEHNVTIPFIRMVAGPMDYTPGAMVNTHPANHRISHFRPMGIGTRCHEIAKYMVYESALQMYCELPSLYLKEVESITFMASIPTVWDETRVIEASVGDYVVIARRHGDTWYLGAMTDDAAREFSLPLEFIGPGEFEATIMQDGVNAAKHAEDYRQVKQTVDADTTLSLRLVGNGGWAAILRPVE
ncbi:glycoside hydrolase family 97 protein [Synoicihabitans lomoniglobus]|uniref:Glycoside hydrolase family 97 protein n=1 Tax=Synoicihabitans lomoniglobus TaxID=2909285 RepID=A0AAF0I594_9BACT|nr:glycoside hydrolase family 97 protein [Opitutaceae bacterium LMO-M01]WED67169.1 glycoside hydrolase family 97 protein [Opitutaceae bacterium LMO-M01]